MFDYKYDDLMNPTLKALKELGGSASNDEIIEKLIEVLSLSEEEIEDIHKGSTTKLEYRGAWARTYLKKAGYITNSKRGVWAITEKGNATTSVNKDNVKNIVKINYTNSAMSDEEGIGEVIENNEIEEFTWQNDVLEVIKAITPEQFEKLCQRMLRELGFTNVFVTGKSHDGGIDGKGILKIGGVISFHTAFQAKRYAGTVSASIIRDFRGAMMGRADKGLVITTGTFSREARKEAQRDGATPIDLIDGNDLAERLKELSLGIEVEMVEKVHVDGQWFKNI
ncbi:restriction endonuclease [Vallitalea okinawensis]|uniref:restriction endonuclease n=1 Tax=Vallitalea okinawensis TaxID=2078660 RepID=UPI000CFB1F26|nr:restriction endonuclease [Vallitalea okinawensis]